MLIQLRPTCRLANLFSLPLGLAIALLGAPGRVHAQTLWQTAPARPAPLPAVVKTNEPTPPGTLSAQTRGQAKELRVIHLPPPPAYATRQQRSAQESQSLVNALDDLGLPASASLIPSDLPTTANMSAVGIAPQSSLAGLPPLPSIDEVPLSTPPLATNELSPAETPFKRVNTDSRNYAMQGASATVPQEPKINNFQSGELLAVVGTERILAGDMNVVIQPVIDQNRDKIENASQEAAIRAQLTRQVLPQYVEIKAMYLEFFRDMVGTGSPKELADTQKQVVTKAGKIFFEKQVPDLLKKYKAKDMQELENALREKSLSLRMLQAQFIEQVLSAQVEQKNIPEEYEIDRDEIMSYYTEHRDDWNVPARARWRQLTARFDKYPNRAEAEQAIRTMGNEMLLGGKSFESVAKQSSQGYTADQGGLFDWTTLGGLKSKPVEQAVFTLEPRKLSAIIEDDIGFHIIEVLEREEARTVELAVSQAEIRKKLSGQKREKAIEELRANVMKRTPIWTRWPEDIPGSRPLSDAIGSESAP